ncbi:MAG: GNAT family N-acetyltransferase [Pseudomonadota bacterium]
MTSEKIVVTRGFSHAERREVADVFWDGLGDKMLRVLGPEARGIATMADAMDPDFVFTARRRGRIVGMAGLKRPDGAFGQPRFDVLARHFGVAGGAWRAALTKLDKARARPGTLVLDALCVRSSERGLGVGAALMEACRAEAAARDLEKVTIQVVAENAGARRFYAREGCVEVSEVSLGMIGYFFGISTMVNLELTPHPSG